MITAIIILSVVVIVAVILYVRFGHKSYEKLSFRESVDLTGNPIIVFYNNGRKLNFLLDTGANTSYINESELETCTYTKKEGLTNNIGIEGNNRVLKSVQMPLYYKNQNYEELFLVSDMSKAFNEVKAHSGVTLHGILGVTFFTNYEYVLDFQELVAYSKKKL